MIKNRSRFGAASRFVPCALLALSLAACGGEDAPPDALSSENGPTPAPSVPAPPAAPTNTPPVIEGQPVVLARAGDAYSFSPTATDADGNALTYTITGLPDWATFNAANGSLTGTPNDGHAGQTGDIEITVSDGTATDSIGPFRINIAPRDLPNSPPPRPNTAPSLSGTPSGLVVATQSYIFVPTASDADGDRLTFAVTNRPSWATFSTSTGQLSGTPSRSQTGTASNIRISVTDGRTVVALPAFAITVQPLPNNAPVLSGTPASTATVGTAYSFTPSATDADGNTLRWSIENAPSWAMFNTTTGRLSGTPAAAGTFSNIRIGANDGTVTVYLSAFTITASAVPNRAPSITGNPPTSVVAGAPYTFLPSATDPDTGASLRFSIVNPPPWASFDTSNGRLTGTPQANQTGSYTNITISVSDGIASVSLPAFSINVTAPPAATGSARLQWTAPTANIDGSQLMDLAGFRIYYGTSQTNLDRVVTVADPNATTYQISNLTAATWYFSVRAFASDGDESTNSNVAQKTIQ